MCLGHQSNSMSVIWGTKVFNLILHRSRELFSDKYIYIFKQTDGKLVNCPLNINFLFLKLFICHDLLLHEAACFLIPSMLLHLSALAFEILERADTESQKHVYATPSQNPNAIQNIYQNANTFLHHPGWPWKYWVTQYMTFKSFIWTSD